ncbi:hypothetical protein QTP88_015800 [Uroleucon formosanum]
MTVPVNNCGYKCNAHQCKSNFHFTPQKQSNISKMGAEKVSMNIVVVGQIQSAKATKTVAKVTLATSQLMFMCLE